jgi:hypothetical protein
MPADVDRKKRMQRRQLMITLGAAAGSASLPSLAQAAASGTRKPDLGDAVEGHYAGDVISDSKGSSRSGVALTVTRIGVNRVRVSSDYPRLPIVDVALTRALGRIVQTRGNTAFVYDRSKAPPHLDVSFDNEVSWSGSRA